MPRRYQQGIPGRCNKVCQEGINRVCQEGINRVSQEGVTRYAKKVSTRYAKKVSTRYAKKVSAGYTKSSPNLMRSATNRIGLEGGGFPEMKLHLKRSRI